MIGAEGLAAPVAVELIAARAEELAAVGVGAWVDFEHGIRAVFVVLDRNAVVVGIAGGAGGRGKLWFHNDILL
jgi:hypothetical protein